MSQMYSNTDKQPSLALIEKINAVDGFDPTPFAVDFTDLNGGETRKRLPVMIQMAWFRLRYPEGKIAVTVEPGQDCFVATARVYPSYKDSEPYYLAEATASRGYSADKLSVPPREWAQTAAVGIALRNAGFGLQFAMAGEEFEASVVNELPENEQIQSLDTPSIPIGTPVAPPHNQSAVASPLRPKELTQEEKLALAMQQPCPISKYSGKTLGDLITVDPKALTWIATKYTGSGEISAAAKLICEYASQSIA